MDDPQIAMIWALGPLCFSSDPLHGSLFFWFSRGFCHFVSPTMSAAHFVCLCCFLDILLLGEVFTLTDIHHPSTFCIDVFIDLLVLASVPSEKTYRKSSSMTNFFRHSYCSNLEKPREQGKNRPSQNA